MRIGIIGFGRLGQLLTRYMVKDAHVTVYDTLFEDKEKAPALIEKANKWGAKFASLQETCDQQIVIPVVPISVFEQVIHSIKDYLPENCLVADVCSVKEYPLEIMKKHLPLSVSILGTHPMFGPDSASRTVFGTKIVLCPTRLPESTFENIKTYLESHGMKVIETTPEQHDKQISHSLLLSHLLGRALVDFGAKDLEIDTLGYRRLMKIIETAKNDSWQLFDDMNKYNRHAREMRGQFMQTLNEIYTRLDQ